MGKSDMRTCRFSLCKHPSKQIDISKEKFVAIKKKYYHEDCYQQREKNLKKDAQTEADIQLMKHLWFAHIDRTTNYGALLAAINEILERGVSSDYLLFVLQYCIKNKQNLHYPRGLKYFVDKWYIKNEYFANQRKQIYEKKTFVVTKEDNESPQCVPKTTKKNYKDIFNK